MKRILFFNDSLEMGGTEVLLVDLLNNLSKEAHITLLLPEASEKNILIDKISPAVSIKYVYTKKSSHIVKKIWENIMIFFPRFFAKQKGISESDYDEIVCFKETFSARIFAKMSIPKILWIHNILYKRKYEANSFREKFSVWLNKKQLKRVEQSYNNFDKVICVSDAAKEAYISVLHNQKTPNQGIQVLYNAIDLSKVKEKAKESIIDISHDKINFILITRVSPEKRTDRLINSIMRLKEDGYDFHTYIIGDGMDNQAMKDELNQKGISDMITLKGRIENPFPYILQCNWSLCVSERESFSLVLLESMAIGTPVITTDCGGPRNIVDNGKYGILVENSAEGVYKGMKSVLDDHSLSVKYSSELKEAVARFDYHNWLRNVREILAI